jgi:hypothetical protein
MIDRLLLSENTRYHISCWIISCKKSEVHFTFNGFDRLHFRFVFSVLSLVKLVPPLPNLCVPTESEVRGLHFDCTVNIS